MRIRRSHRAIVVRIRRSHRAIVVQHAHTSVAQRLFKMPRAAKLLVVAADEVDTQRRIQREDRRGNHSRIDLAAIEQISRQEDDRRVEFAGSRRDAARKLNAVDMPQVHIRDEQSLLVPPARRQVRLRRDRKSWD